MRFITADASHPVIIRLNKQRVLCNDCLKRSMAQSNLVNKYCHISNASKRKVLAALTEDRSMTSIAREHNLSVNTVQRVLESCSSRTRFKPDYFYKFSPKARAMVKTVSMDLNCYYPIVAKELFPNAQIVIDRFHMVQMLTRSFNSLRVQT